MIDPTYALLPEGILGWQLVDERYLPWEPAADGRLHSKQLPLAFALEGALARVYRGDGNVHAARRRDVGRPGTARRGPGTARRGPGSER